MWWRERVDADIFAGNGPEMAQLASFRPIINRLPEMPLRYALLI